MPEPFTLWTARDAFTTWLHSLPPQDPLPHADSGGLVAFLRAQGDAEADLVEREGEGWQDYVFRGQVEDIPGLFFYWLGECPAGEPSAGVAALAWEAYLAEWDQ